MGGGPRSAVQEEAACFKPAAPPNQNVGYELFLTVPLGRAAQLEVSAIRRNIIRASGRHPALRAAQSTVFEFEPEKPRFIDRARKGKPQRMPPGKTKGLVIRCVADEQNGAMPRGDRPEQSFSHQPAAKPARAIGIGDRERAKQKRRDFASPDRP